MKFLNRILYKNRKFYDDDFDWDSYTDDSYERRVVGNIESQHLAIARPGDLAFDSETGEVSSRRLPLHPNHNLILEAIGQLQPASVHEVGCGGGDHVANAALLYDKIKVTGSDRGSTGARAILLSKEKLNLPELTSDAQIREGLKPSKRRLVRADEDSERAIIGY